MMSRGSYGADSLEDVYRSAYVRDLLPKKNSELERLMLSDTRLLEAEIIGESSRTRSVIATLYSHCALNFADFILKRNDDFVDGADPFYCGKSEKFSDILLHSAGLNFYLALNTLRFYARHRKLTDLIRLSDSDEILEVKKTHFDCLYWTGADGACRPVVFGVSEYDRQYCTAEVIEHYIREIAPAFMRWAYEIFKVELQLDRETHLDGKIKLYQSLNEAYLQVAHMEDSSFGENAFRYFFKQAGYYYGLLHQDKKDVVKDKKYISESCWQEDIFRLQLLKSTQQKISTERVRDLVEWTHMYESEVKYSYPFARGKNIFSREMKYVDRQENVSCIVTDTMTYPLNSYPKIEHLKSETKRVARTPSPSSVIARTSDHKTNPHLSQSSGKLESPSIINMTLNPLCSFFSSTDRENAGRQDQVSSAVITRAKKND